MTLEDTRALAGHKLVCELLQKSLGLWIEWIDSYHWETIELIQRTLYGGVSFMFPFNQDHQIRVEYMNKAGLYPLKYEGLLRKCQQHPTANVR